MTRMAYLLLRSDGRIEEFESYGPADLDRLSEILGAYPSVQRWQREPTGFNLYVGYDQEPEPEAPLNVFNPVFQGDLLLGRLDADEFVGLVSMGDNGELSSAGREYLDEIRRNLIAGLGNRFGRGELVADAPVLLGSNWPMIFPVYTALHQSNTMKPNPHFFSSTRVSIANYLAFASGALRSASAASANDQVAAQVAGQDMTLGDLVGVKLIHPSAAPVFVEVDVAVASTYEGARHVRSLPTRCPNWAALVIDTEPLADHELAELNPSIARYLNLDFVALDGATAWLPVAQVAVGLDHEGRALSRIHGPNVLALSVSSYIPAVPPEEVETWLGPILVRLGEINGQLPRTLKVNLADDPRPKFAIREALLSGNGTDLDPNRESFANQISGAPAVDASATARRYLAEELSPNYDWTMLGKILPPVEPLYIEITAPSILLSEDGRMIPFSSLVGAGIAWSALVSVERGKSALVFDLSVLDSIYEEPRSRIARIRVPLDASGISNCQSQVFTVIRSVRARDTDEPNYTMWMHPIVQKLAEIAAASASR